MSPEQENFESLRRLLVLKRYEQPPPGYFNNFSHEVLARIRVDERGAEPVAFKRRSSKDSWFQRLLAAVEAKPVWAGAFGLAVCGLLTTAVVLSDSPEAGAVALQGPEAAFQPQTIQVAAGDATANVPIEAVPAPAVVNTGTVLTSEAAPSLFQEIGTPWVVQPASYSAPAGQ